jgi:hypothetical protein
VKRGGIENDRLEVLGIQSGCSLLTAHGSLFVPSVGTILNEPENEPRPPYSREGTAGENWNGH